jgi:hypothetical protein
MPNSNGTAKRPRKDLILPWRRPPSGGVSEIAQKGVEVHGDHRVDKSLPSAADAVPQPVDDAVEVKFPRCNAAVCKRDASEWNLADAILAECSQTGEDGVRNGSYAKINAMREEIAQNHGIDLSFERVRKLRKVAAAFPPGRRRPAVSLESHLEAGTTEALDDVINRTPGGVAVRPHPDPRLPP